MSSRDARRISAGKVAGPTCALTGVENARKQLATATRITVLAPGWLDTTIPAANAEQIRMNKNTLRRNIT